jgi:hypothetical protein
MFCGRAAAKATTATDWIVQQRGKSGQWAYGAVVAYALVWLIAVITNISFDQEFSSVFQSPDHHRLG